VMDAKSAPDQEEILHFNSVIKAFSFYEEYSLNWIQRMHKAFLDIPQKHQLLIPNAFKKLDSLRRCVSMNFILFQAVITEQQLFQNHNMELYYSVQKEDEISALPKEKDMDKVKSTLRQFMREWSDEGLEERKACFQPILQELERRFPTVNDRHSVKVLNPGCGLGRLAFEIARLGFFSQGNEFSYYMLLGSNYILNRCDHERQFSLFPFVHQTSNVNQDDDQLREVFVPDMVPINQLRGENEFSICAGDFLEVYADQVGQWDCIVTCFFMDTARNIVEYVETISNILKPGGVWINLGPLLYHYAEMEGEQSIELSFEQLQNVITSFGFEIQVSLQLYLTNSSYLFYQTGTENLQHYVHFQ